MDFKTKKFFECLEICKAEEKCGGISHSTSDDSCLLWESCQDVIEFSGFQSVEKYCPLSKFAFRLH